MLPLLLLLITAQAPRDLSVTAAHSRHALVIGNAAYPTWPLKNPLNDARSVSASLSAAGFQTTTATDLTLRVLEESVNRLIGKVKDGDLVLFYYAGHGLQIRYQEGGGCEVCFLLGHVSAGKAGAGGSPGGDTRAGCLREQSLRGHPSNG